MARATGLFRRVNVTMKVGLKIGKMELAVPQSRLAIRRERRKMKMV